MGCVAWFVSHFNDLEFTECPTVCFVSSCLFLKSVANRLVKIFREIINLVVRLTLYDIIKV